MILRFVVVVAVAVSLIVKIQLSKYIRNSSENRSIHPWIDMWQILSMWHDDKPNYRKYTNERWTSKIIQLTDLNVWTQFHCHCIENWRFSIVYLRFSCCISFFFHSFFSREFVNSISEEKKHEYRNRTKSTKIHKVFLFNMDNTSHCQVCMDFWMFV